jgi:hypothetical protein
MFFIVLKDFAQFFLAYSAIIMAFAMSFAVMFSRHKEFASSWGSILSTFVMMTGEYNYPDIFFDDEQPVEYAYSSHGLFLLFILFMTIIMMNLLVGMAVNDIQALQKSAKLERLVRQTMLMAHIESTVLSNYLAFLPRRVARMLQGAALLVPESYRSVLYTDTLSHP